jgi:hypothetical protein
MSDQDFEIKDRQKSDLPDFLKKRQKMGKPAQARQAAAFNRIIHVDTIYTHNKSGKTILVITDDARTH